MPSRENAEAASRVANISKRVVEEIVVEIINTFLKELLEYVTYTAALNWDEVKKRLVERRLRPDTPTLLSIMEELSDLVDFDESIKSADDTTRSIIEKIIGICIGLTRRFVPRDLIEKFTYENALAQAEKRGMSELLHYLKSYPNLCRRLIDWLRSKLV